MKTIIIFMGLFFWTLTSQSQNVITVDNRPNTGADYSSLSDAVTNAIVGDTIQIHPSSTTYGSTGNVNKRLVFVGMGHNPANSMISERARISTITFTGNSANSLVTGLEISSVTITSPIDVTGIRIINNKILSYINGSNSTASNNWIIEGNIFINGYINPQINTNGWLVKNNIFDNNSQFQIQNCNDQTSFLNNIVVSSSGNFANNCENPIVSNNVFILEGNTTIVNLNNSTAIFSNNLTRNVQGQTVTVLSGNNNLDNTDPGFSFAFGDIADYYNNDYNVNGAAEDAGTDNTDLGVFGAGFAFDVNGRPDDFPYMTNIDITNPSVPMGQDINVTFTAEKKN